MDKEHAKKIVIDIIKSSLDDPVEVNDDTQLVGTGALLDSMKLVEICVALEDAAEENQFEFDWTSDATMSKSRSMFRTVANLAEEFSNQSNN